jgi:hypothetical protein
MSKLVALLFLVFSFYTWSQDKLFYKDGRIEDVKVNEINKFEVKFKRMNNLEGPNFVSLKTELISIQYENGMVENFVDEMTNLNDAELLKYAAIKDAWRYYKDYKKGTGMTILGCVFLTPIGGIFVAKKYANQEIDIEKRPRTVKVKGINGNEFVDNPYYSNEIYKENYKNVAKKIQKLKIWKAFGGGTAITAGVGGLITIIIVTINEMNSFYY